MQLSSEVVQDLTHIKSLERMHECYTLRSLLTSPPLVTLTICVSLDRTLPHSTCTGPSQVPTPLATPTRAAVPTPFAAPTPVNASVAAAGVTGIMLVA